MSETYFTNNAEKIDVIMPMLGGGTRMKGMQNTCKPLYELPDGSILFIKALESLKHYNIARLVLVVLEEYEDEFRKYVGYLQNMTKAEVHIVPHEPTKCQVDSFKVGLEFLNVFSNRYPVISLDCDITGELPMIQGNAPTVFGFYHNNPNKSFIRYEQSRVLEIVEKKAISNRAVFGAYYFPDVKQLEEVFEKNEFEYMSEIYRYFLKENVPVYWYPAENVVNYGTKEEWEESTNTGILKRYKAFLCL